WIRSSGQGHGADEHEWRGTMSSRGEITPWVRQLHAGQYELDPNGGRSRRAPSANRAIGRGAPSANGRKRSGWGGKRVGPVGYRALLPAPGYRQQSMANGWECRCESDKWFLVWHSSGL